MLKVDIEFSEFTAIPQFLADPKSPVIDQILVEVHGVSAALNLTDIKTTAMNEGFIRLFDALDAHGFEIVHAEWNDLAPSGLCHTEYVLVRRGSGLLLVE